MKRSQVLDTAKEYVCKGREETHGKPEDTFATIAEFWSIYLDVRLEAHDVAAMMALLKLARVKANFENDDNWVDLAGYSACGAELAEALKKENPEIDWYSPELTLNFLFGNVDD